MRNQARSPHPEDPSRAIAERRVLALTGRRDSASVPRSGMNGDTFAFRVLLGVLVLHAGIHLLSILPVDFWTWLPLP